MIVWTTFKLDKLVYYEILTKGVRAKHSPWRTEGKFHFPTTVAGNQRQHPGEIGKKEQWVNEDSYQRQHSQVSICGAWSREEHKISLSLPFQIQIGKQKHF